MLCPVVLQLATCLYYSNRNHFKIRSLCAFVLVFRPLSEHLPQLVRLLLRLRPQFVQLLFRLHPLLGDLLAHPLGEGAVVGPAITISNSKPLNIVKDGFLLLISISNLKF